jgi:NAD(P)-dependent dehydrogenase (short-subunit alcohol dehydrogenase family)
MATLTGRVAFVTGAAMGNGEGIARAMLEKGARVILADKSEAVLATAASLGENARAYPLDITDGAAVAAAAEELIAEYGHVDILVNNAGAARFVDVRSMDDATLDMLLAVNVKGAWSCVKAFINHMLGRRYGRIINMSSVTGTRVSDPGMMAYGITKGAMLAFTKTAAMDVAKYGITVNAISPGYILTPMVQKSARETDAENPQRVIDGIAAGVPLGRLGEPIEVGYLAAFLASDEAAYITGTEIILDGGSTLPETSVMGVK